MKHAIDTEEPGTTGEKIVRLSKSPFVDDETVAKWIDNAIVDAVAKAVRHENDRIEKRLANMSDTELERAIQTARFKWNAGHRPNRAERRGRR